MATGPTRPEQRVQRSGAWGSGFVRLVSRTEVVQALCGWRVKTLAGR